MNKLYISILESIYLIYMYWFFETSINFDVLKIKWNSKLLKHLTDETYGLRICPFGQISILVLVCILLIRNFYKIESVYINYSLYIALGLSLLMNLNSFVYLLPVFICELLLN